MTTRREAIQQFLHEHAHPEVAARYHPGLESQVLTAMDEGVLFTGVYQGRKWKGYHSRDTGCDLSNEGHERDPETCHFWKDFRIPWNSGTDAEYEDTEQRWSLEDHALGIGSTGWNWEQGVSEWFGFDFDSVANHASYGKALNDVDMARVLGAVSTLDWVEVRRSKSGRGHHLYVTLDDPIQTANHHEHAALARAILHLMSGLVGEHLASSVDCVGGNIWLWHRDQGPGAFELVKEGTKIEARLVPADWRRHLDVTRSKRRRVASPAATGSEDDFDDLQKRTRRVELDDEHKALLAWHAQHNAEVDWAWDADYHMLRTHSAALKRAHIELGMRGIYYTASEGHDLMTGNCFGFPLQNGAWEIRRHGKGADEHAAWNRDSSGWTRCVLNTPASLDQVCKANGGTLDSDGVYHFDRLDAAIAATRDLDVVLDGLDDYLYRPALVFMKKGKAVVRFERHDSDEVPTGWIKAKAKVKWWERVFDHTEPRETVDIPDEIVRAVVASGTHSGFYLWSRGLWVDQPAGNVEKALMAAHGMSSTDAKQHMGVALLNHWTEVVEPFADEYPGDRKWNRQGARLSKLPVQGEHPYWDKLLAHLGRGLDESIAEDPWCRKYGVVDGAHYLKLWCASMFQFPRLRLPYLFFFSPEQGTGKSLFHEALSMFFQHDRGYVNAKIALTSKGDFTARLLGAILCVVEEVDLKRDKNSYAKIKDWTMNPRITIHPKGKDDYDTPNYTHWIQCANASDHCPIAAGDTRIVMVRVPKPSEEIPKEVFRSHLEEEASAFLYTLMELDIPPTADRLRIPTVTTSVKEDAEESSMDDLQVFLRDHCARMPGAMISWSNFYQKFYESVDPMRRMYWPEKSVRTKLPPDYPKGKYGKTGDIYVGNLAWANGKADKKLKGGHSLVRSGTRLKSL